MSNPQIVWLRRDLRLTDQPAFYAAAEAGPVLAVYILDDGTAGDRRLGGASRWWLHHSLIVLSDALEQRGSRLILRRGDCVEHLTQIAEETGARGIHALHHYEPWWRDAEQRLADKFELILHDGNYLMPPGSVTTGSGDPYKIYTPFMKALMPHMPPHDPLPEPKLIAPDHWPASDKLADWHLVPTTPDWSTGFGKHWQVGEGAAHDRLKTFHGDVAEYEAQRNHPSTDGTSQFSPHLHWGEISPAQVWHAIADQRGEGADTYRRELIWRDFTQNIILRFSRYPECNYRKQFDSFPWRDHTTGEGKADLLAWQQGCTGYPIVDAGMRQLWHIGWMHNRVRMIAASFLIKHLLIDWRVGERWFWDCLVDADYGNNSVNWQWVSGTGVDTQLFTRIMAPLSQSDKFDAAGYIREWVPELADLSDGEIHDPADDARPAAYPARLIGHREARERALAAYESI